MRRSLSLVVASTVLLAGVILPAAASSAEPGPGPSPDTGDCLSTTKYIQWHRPSLNTAYGAQALIRFTARDMATCYNSYNISDYAGSGVLLQKTPSDGSHEVMFGWSLDQHAYDCNPTCWDWWWAAWDGAKFYGGAGVAAGSLDHYVNDCAQNGGYGMFQLNGDGSGVYTFRFRCDDQTGLVTLGSTPKLSFGQGTPGVVTWRFGGAATGMSDDAQRLAYKSTPAGAGGWVGYGTAPTCMGDGAQGWDGSDYFLSGNYGYETYKVTGSDPVGC